MKEERGRSAIRIRDGVENTQRQSHTNVGCTDGYSLNVDVRYYNRLLSLFLPSRGGGVYVGKGGVHVSRPYKNLSIQSAISHLEALFRVL